MPLLHCFNDIFVKLFIIFSRILLMNLLFIVYVVNNNNNK